LPNISFRSGLKGLRQLNGRAFRISTLSSFGTEPTTCWKVIITSSRKLFFLTGGFSRSLFAPRLIATLKAQWVSLRERVSTDEQPASGGALQRVDRGVGGRKLPVAVDIPELIPAVHAELSRRDLRPFATVSNGLCMYHSLGISHARGAALSVLQDVVAEIIRYLRGSRVMQEQLAPRLVVEGRSFEEFILALQNGAEGDEGVLQAYANLHALRITVLSNMLQGQAARNPGAPVPPVTFHPQGRQGRSLGRRGAGDRAHSSPTHVSTRWSLLNLSLFSGGYVNDNGGHYLATLPSTAFNADIIKSSIATGNVSGSGSQRGKKRGPYAKKKKQAEGTVSLQPDEIASIVAKAIAAHSQAGPVATAAATAATAAATAAAAAEPVAAAASTRRNKKAPSPPPEQAFEQPTSITPRPRSTRSVTKLVSASQVPAPNSKLRKRSSSRVQLSPDVAGPDDEVSEKAQSQPAPSKRRTVSDAREEGQANRICRMHPAQLEEGESGILLFFSFSSIILVRMTLDRTAIAM
jgi:hypothetical protein